MVSVIEKVNEMKRGKQWLVFFGSAIVALLVLLIPFVARGHHLVWVAQAGDAATQGVTFLNRLREVGWFKAIGSYDFYLGLGSDFLTSMSFFSLFDPFNVLVFIFPFDIVWVYDIIMLLKFIAAGAAIFIYLHWRKVKGGYSVALSLIYMFTGFLAFTFVRHLNLTSGAIYLPLMIMGLEQVYQKKNPFVFIGFSFLCLINSFYMFFFNSVFVVLYAFLYHAEVCSAAGGGRTYWKTLIPSLWKIAVFYLVAIVLAGFMLLPNAYAYLHAARSESKGLIGITFSFLTGAVFTYFTHTVSNHYSIIGFNLFIDILLLAAFLICKRQKKAFAFRVCTVILTIGFFVPLFGYFMNIFNYSNNRWSYILNFCMISLIGLNTQNENADEIYPISLRRKIAKAITVFVGFGVVCALGVAIKTLLSGNFSSPVKISLTVLSFAAVAIVAALIFWALSGRSPYADREKDGVCVPNKILDNVLTKKLATPNILWHVAALCTVACCLFFYIGYSADHEGAALYRSLTTPSQQYVSELNENSVFRTDSEGGETWWSCFRNLGVNNSYMGTRAYNSMSNASVYEFLRENEVYNPTQNLGISGLDNRAALQTLLSVQYYCGENGGYGFTPVSGYDDLFKNENYVPFGFVYRNTVSKEYYESLDPLLRQYAMLSAMVVEGEGSAEAPALGELTELPITLSEKTAENFSLEKGDKIALTATGCAGKEIYIRFNHAAEVKETTEFSISGNGKTRTYYYKEKGDLMYSSQRDPVICLGVAEADTLQIDLSLIDGRKISFDSVEVLGYSVTDYQRAADALQEAPHLENVERSENAVTGEVALGEGGWMFFSLPYDSGWKAYVDGKEQPILRANSGFMAVELQAGGHTVELRYTTPYLKEGVLVTAVGIAAFAAVCAVYVVQKVRGGPSSQEGGKQE